MEKEKQNMVGFDRVLVGFFAMLFLTTATISTIHVYDFFILSNGHRLSIALSVAFEVGQIIVLAAIIRNLDFDMLIIWFMFIVLTLMQIMGNMYHSFIHLSEYQGWIELFGLQDRTDIVQRRILSVVQGAVLPIITLGFAKSLTNYIKSRYKNSENKSNVKESEKDDSINKDVDKDVDKFNDIFNSNQQNSNAQENIKADNNTVSFGNGKITDTVEYSDQNDQNQQQINNENNSNDEDDSELLDHLDNMDEESNDNNKNDDNDNVAIQNNNF